MAGCGERMGSPHLGLSVAPPLRRARGQGSPRPPPPSHRSPPFSTRLLDRETDRRSAGQRRWQREETGKKHRNQHYPRSHTLTNINAKRHSDVCGSVGHPAGQSHRLRPGGAAPGGPPLRSPGTPTPAPPHPCLPGASVPPPARGGLCRAVPGRAGRGSTAPLPRGHPSRPMGPRALQTLPHSPTEHEFTQ